MCGRFGQARKITELKQLYAAEGNIEWPGSYNIAPTELAPVIIETTSQERELKLARFGMPMTIKGKSFLLLNVQSEKAATREDFKFRRCVIPADGFYEWEKVSPKDRQPYYFSPKQGIFSFAGLWMQGRTGLCFTILTVSANELVQPIHGRMPVILGHNAVYQWLAPNSTVETLKLLVEPFPASLMQSWKVSKAVNSPSNKDIICINSL
ncbi:SOS response-associated peptidase [Ktedonosporobacter rubrisoli]|uniref:Abasic site processing protein n=1 Tax=Ktedonosporobacter rubrisoli TaxID=2509675 RepID=A0A4P6JJA6_KTERU|nr:SOS response-associated peptidase [Ktedonosporobacter rubrisoli]QBD75178.1 SOS response-associated peptidase [Ktedonosporobacter rubrisoli]